MPESNRNMTVCEHGSLRRQCQHCDVNRLEREVADLQAKLAEAEKELHEWRNKRLHGGCHEDLMTEKALLAGARNEAIELCNLWDAATEGIVEREANDISREIFDKIEAKVLHIQSIME